jgi:hypothetical protein
LRAQRERRQRAVARLDPQLVIDEIKFDLEGAFAVRHQRRLLVRQHSNRLLLGAAQYFLPNLFKGGPDYSAFPRGS